MNSPSLHHPWFTSEQLQQCNPSICNHPLPLYFLYIQTCLVIYIFLCIWHILRSLYVLILPIFPEKGKEITRLTDEIYNKNIRKTYFFNKNISVLFPSLSSSTSHFWKFIVSKSTFYFIFYFFEFFSTSLFDWIFSFFILFLRLTSVSSFFFYQSRNFISNLPNFRRKK